ncbi:MAG: MBL fold metallo-hydrolase [Anaerolineae bacterium]|nr:MBL fold metallo-hydrolase [Anaerolineae bacterium]
MPKLVILGTSYAVPDVDHENTHMALVGEERMVLIDGGGNPQTRLAKAGLHHEDLTDIVMTHFHPDHVSGIPLLIMGMGLLKRQKPLLMYANDHCMNFMQNLLNQYEWNTFHFFPVTFKTVPDDELHLIIDTDEFKVYTSPVKHFIPTFGLRIEFPKSGKVVAFSCDSAPTPSLVKLAQDADILIHEAAGESIGHSSAAQAGEIARQANAKEMYLIHYPTNGFNYHALVDEAKKEFDGPVHIAEDLMEFEF